MEAMTGDERLRGREREARDNDRILLQAAREVFVQRGWQAPMSAIAEHAGIGIASIYRRYPSKEELVLQLRIMALGDVIRIAAESLEGEGSSVARFLRQHIRQAATPLMITFGRHVRTSPEIDVLAEELRIALDALIAHDRSGAHVPPGYSAADLMLGVTHLRPNLPTTPERTTEIHLRHVDYYLLGLAEAARHPELVSGVGATWDEWLAFNAVDEDQAEPATDRRA